MKQFTGKDLRKIRKSHGLSQILLADRLGFSVATINRWESGKLAITRSRATEIQYALARLDSGEEQQSRDTVLRVKFLLRRASEGDERARKFLEDVRLTLAEFMAGGSELMPRKH